jgi:membrane-associated protease RseP (regulator of RpoE activity)
MTGVLLWNQGRLLPYFAVPILVHECGHIIVILLCRVSVREIRFSAQGIEIRRDPTVILSDPAELCLCLGGIVANLLAAASLYLFCFQSLRMMLLVASNVAMALYNALPIGDLDGGQAVRLLTARFFPPDMARAVSLICSLLVLAILFAFAIFLLLSGWYNPTLLIACGYLIYHLVRNI